MDMQNTFHPERFSLHTCGRIDCPEHTNFGIEIAIVKTGILSMKIEQEDYTLTPGQAVVLYPYESHDYRGDSSLRFLSILLSGDANDLFFRFTDYRRTTQRVFTVPQAVIDFLNYLELTAGGSSSENDDTLIMSVLAPILHCLKHQLQFSGERTYQSAFMQAVNYIDAHYSDGIKLSEVAEAVGVNPSFLSRTFSKNAGMSLTTYVNVRRVILAANMLKNTTDKIADIAGKVGFGTVRSFNRAFVQHFPVTPAQYRSQQTVKQSVPNASNP